MTLRACPIVRPVGCVRTFTCRRAREGRDGTTGGTITHGDGSSVVRARQRPRLTWTARPASACSCSTAHSKGAAPTVNSGSVITFCKSRNARLAYTVEENNTMSWPIVCAGSAMFDDTTTPYGRREGVPGGSLVYASLAARRYAPVRAVGIVGNDGRSAIVNRLAASGVNIDDIEVVEGPTFREHSIHDYHTGSVIIERSEPGVYSDWEPKLSPPAAMAPALFVGSMDPRIQLAILTQSRASLKAMDSMMMHINNRREEVLRVAVHADMAFLNEEEMGELVGTGKGWRRQAEGLLGRGRMRAVVVKRGAKGAAYVSTDAFYEFPAISVDRVVDPSGAGDSLAGGFLGACAAAGRDDEEFAPIGLRAGLQCAADAISQFGVAGLSRNTDPIL